LQSRYIKSELTPTHTVINSVSFANLFAVVFVSERMQCEARDLENPSAVHVTVSTGQVTV